MSLGAGSDIPMKEPAVMGADEAERQVAVQNDLNEQNFSRLNHEYEQVNRTVNYLEQALQAAQIRQAVLAAACDRLNAPQTAAPSIR